MSDQNIDYQYADIYLKNLNGNINFNTFFDEQSRSHNHQAKREKQAINQ